LRAAPSSPGATERSGIGSRPTNTRPITISAKPAIFSWVVCVTTPAIAAAPAPSTTNPKLKPAMNGRLESTTRRAAPRSPSRSTSIAETAER
jgi:hypothetical protein